MLAIQSQRRRISQAASSIAATTARNDWRTSHAIIGPFAGYDWRHHTPLAAAAPAIVVVPCPRSLIGARHRRRRRNHRRYFSSSSATDEVVAIHDGSPSSSSSSPSSSPLPPPSPTLASPVPVVPGKIATSSASGAGGMGNTTTTTTHARIEWQQSPPASLASIDSRRRMPRRHTRGGRPGGDGIDVDDDDDDDCHDDEDVDATTTTHRGKRERIEEFHGMWTECLSSLPRRDGDGDDGGTTTTTTTIEGILASVDRFTALLDHPDLDAHLGMIIPSRGGGEGGGSRHTRAMLHHALLRLVDICLPPTPPTSSSSSSSHAMGARDDDERRRRRLRQSSEYSGSSYSAATVGRALRLSRRAEEVGLPPHRPLYRRLAVGVVLTSVPSRTPSHRPPAIDARRTTDDDADPESSPPPLPVPPIDSPPREVGSTVPFALPSELLGIFDGARSALGIHDDDELRRLARDILADPALLLLEAKRLEEAAALLRGWKDATDAFASHDLTSLLGEEGALRALDIAQGWVDDVELADRVASNRDVLELTTMLEGALDEVLRGRRRRAEKISHLLWRLSMRDEDHHDDFDEEDGGSDSDYEVEFDFDEEEEEDDDEEEEEEEKEEKFYSSTPAQLRGNEPVNLASFKADSDHPTTVSYTATNLSNSKVTSKESEDDESFTIIKGLSNEEARRSIYIRNSADWHLADIVPQLQDWNKGRMLTFTPMFEKYVGNQIANCASDSDDEEEYDED